MPTVRFARPGLKVVTQPQHAQFIVYSVPDDIAAQFDCESRLTLSEGRTVRRAYGNLYGATFNVAGARDQTVALLWGNVGGYWKIVAWRTGAEAREPPAPPLTQRSPAGRCSGRCDTGRLRVGVFDQYDSRPPAALSKNDWGWSNSFGLKF